MGDDLLFEKAKQKAFRLLSVRSRSIKELRLKLKERGFEETVVNNVIDRLLDLKYLDDEAFAKDWARNLAVNRLWGNRKIEISLLEKGISGELAEQSIVHAREEIGERDAIQKLVEKKCDKAVASEADARFISTKEKGRLIRNLMGRSFPLGLIFDVLGDVPGNTKEEYFDDRE